jgi:hypothetical protein
MSKLRPGEGIVVFADPDKGGQATYLRGRLLKEGPDFLELVDGAGNLFRIRASLILKLKKPAPGGQP